MYYIIGEGNLRDLLAGENLEPLLKSKQSVELMAEGEVIIDDEDGELWIGEGETWLYGELKHLEGQNIKIYIQKIIK